MSQENKKYSAIPIEEYHDKNGPNTEFGETTSSPLIPDNLRKFGYDEAYINLIPSLIRMPLEEVERRAEEKIAIKLASDRELAQKSENLSQLIRRNQELEMILIKLKIDSEIQKEELPKVIRSLNEVQDRYNSSVDAFNKLKEKTNKNKGAYQEVAKTYNDQNQNLDDYKEELNQQVATMNQKIAEDHQILNEKQLLLNSATEDLAMKTDMFLQTRELRKTLEIEMSQYDMEELSHKFEELKIVQEQKQSQLDNLLNEVHLAKTTIHDLNEKNIETEKNLEEMQNNYSGLKGENSILEQRIENENKIVGQLVVTKITKHEQRVHQENINLAYELREKIVKEADNVLILDQLKQEKFERIKKLGTLKDDIKQKKRLFFDMSEQIVGATEKNQKLQEQKNSLVDAISNIQTIKSDDKKKAEDTAAAYGKKIKKQKRKQTLLGFVDDESSKKSSDERETSTSQISSSLLDTELGLVEKINLDTSMDTSSKKPKI